MLDTRGRRCRGAAVVLGWGGGEELECRVLSESRGYDVESEDDVMHRAHGEVHRVETQCAG